MSKNRTRVSEAFLPGSRSLMLTPSEEQTLCRQVNKDLVAHRKALTAWKKVGAPENQRPRLESEAMQKLVLHNLGLAGKYAAVFSHRGIDGDELFQEAVLGLHRAAELFDHKRGVRFATYAVWWIKQFIVRCLQNRVNTVRIPTHATRLLRVYRSLKQETLSTELRLPTKTEVIERLRCSEVVYRTVMDLDRCGTISLSSLNQEEMDSQLEILDTRTEDPYQMACRADDREYIECLLRYLPNRFRSVVEMRFGIGYQRQMTLEEVGSVLKVTRERVRQLEKKAMATLRRIAFSTERGALEIVRHGRDE